MLTTKGNDVTSCLLVKERPHTLHSMRISSSRLKKEKVIKFVTRISSHDGYRHKGYEGGEFGRI